MEIDLKFLSSHLSFNLNALPFVQFAPFLCHAGFGNPPRAAAPRKEVACPIDGPARGVWPNGSADRWNRGSKSNNPRKEPPKIPPILGAVSSPPSTVFFALSFAVYLTGLNFPGKTLWDRQFTVQKTALIMEEFLFPPRSGTSLKATSRRLIESAWFPLRPIGRCVHFGSKVGQI